mgnify:CR=1 FL=1
MKMRTNYSTAQHPKITERSHLLQLKLQTQRLQSNKLFRQFDLALSLISSRLKTLCTSEFHKCSPSIMTCSQSETPTSR